jgi:hypothetical protein
MDEDIFVFRGALPERPPGCSCRGDLGASVLPEASPAQTGWTVAGLDPAAFGVTAR